jgi:hypothetical protein
MSLVVPNQIAESQCQCTICCLFLFVSRGMQATDDDADNDAKDAVESRLLMAGGE